MPVTDPNLEWLGHVQPTGLVVAPAVLGRHGLTPLQQTRADSEAVAETPLTLADPWPFFATILDWPGTFVAGAPGGPPVPDDLCAVLPDAPTTLAPTWAVATPERTGWQMLVRIEAPASTPTRAARSPGGRRRPISAWNACCARPAFRPACC